jgi:Zn-dependent protease
VDTFLKISLTVIPLLFAVVLHEIAHGYVAKRLGDPTASDAGRLTLNPIKHIDPFWTILLPALLISSGSPIVFGGAKPVPVDPRYFKYPRRGMMWTALAGPATNIILAIISFLLFALLMFCLHYFVAQPDTTLDKILLITATFFLLLLKNSVLINLVLAIVNLTPIPPLDGGRIVSGILPWQMAKHFMRLERIGIFIVIALLYFGILDRVIFFLINPILKLFETFFGF